MYEICAFFRASELEQLIEDHYLISVDLQEVLESKPTQDTVRIILSKNPIKQKEHPVTGLKRLVQDYLRQLLPNNIDYVMIDMEG